MDTNRWGCLEPQVLGGQTLAQLAALHDSAWTHRLEFWVEAHPVLTGVAVDSGWVWRRTTSGWPAQR